MEQVISRERMPHITSSSWTNNLNPELSKDALKTGRLFMLSKSGCRNFANVVFTLEK